MIDIVVNSQENNFKYGVCKAQFKAYQKVDSYPDYLIYWFQIFYKDETIFFAPYVCCNIQAFDWKNQNDDEFEIIPPLLTYVNKPTDITKTHDIVCKVIVKLFASGHNPEIVCVKPKKHTRDGLKPTFLRGVIL